MSTGTTLKKRKIRSSNSKPCSLKKEHKCLFFCKTVESGFNIVGFEMFESPFCSKKLLKKTFCYIRRCLDILS